ncbi:hypothetical protein OAG94_00785 [bacterium]|nr:hypothetical protein [bacterium]
MKRIEYLRGLFSSKKLGTRNKMVSPDTLLVVYDLNSSPITFDFAHFLAAADSYGKTHEKSNLFLLIVQRDLDPLLADRLYADTITEDSQNWRLNNIILQLIQLYPACIGYSFLSCKSEILNFISNQLVYPSGYSHTYKPSLDYVDIFKLINLKLFSGFHAPKQGLSYIHKWKKLNAILNPMVVITLRQYGYDVARNSNIEEWVKFAHWVKEQGFTPIFVPDTDSCWVRNDLFDDFIVFNEPCWNLGLRMALNELSFVNLFYYNGPASICTLNKKVRTIVFFPVIEESIHGNSTTIKQFGLTNGQRRYNFAELHQFLSWKRDSFENIKDEFTEFQKYVPLG